MRKCLFCSEERNLTEEHVISKWISKHGHVSRAHKKTIHTVSELDPQQVLGAPVYRTSKRFRAGDPLSVKQKVVCSPCNSRWMSDIVKAAQPHLAPLIAGSWPHLEEDGCTKVAAWAALSTMVWETAAAERAQAIRQPDRLSIMTSPTPPADWEVWIGVSEEVLQTMHFHRGFGLIDPEGIASHRAFMQATTFTLGRFAFVTYSGHFGGPMKDPAFTPAPGFARIWPLSAVVPNRPSKALGPGTVQRAIQTISQRLGLSPTGPTAWIDRVGPDVDDDSGESVP